MNITLDEIRSKAPDGASHIWQNDYGVGYFYYSKDLKQWFYYDKHHDIWISQRNVDLTKIKPL